MNNNKRLFLWGAIAVAILAAVIIFLFLNLSSGQRRSGFAVSEGSISVYDGIPSDAVVVLDFKTLAEYRPMLEDTASFAYKIFNEESGLVRLQEDLLDIDAISSVPFVYSLHYSSKNNVSFLQVVDLKSVNQDDVTRLLLGGEREKKYNGVNIYSLPYGIVAALHNNLLLASSSSYLLESSIRHLENSTSILDNGQFADLLSVYGDATGVFVNHNQIGKLFSGIVERGFLGYSDFVMKFTSWSRLDAVVEPGKLELSGVMENAGDDARFSNIILSQHPKRSAMGKILPASTLFAVSIPLSGVQEYLKAHGLYLEMQKKQGSFAYMQKMARGTNATDPLKWVDSLEVEELVSAFCRFGEKCEWLTFIKGKQPFGLNNVISAVVEGEKVETPQPFQYKGYLASVFGELFSHCNEEAVCKVGGWTILGPQKVLDEFANGNAYFYNLEHYLGQTPVEGYLSKEASVKMVVNVKEAGDSLLQVFKPYARECLKNQLDRNNFEFLTMDMKGAAGEPVVEVGFYASVMEQLPVPREREESGQVSFQIDSTIHLPEGPFKVWDVAKKSDAWLEQLPNMRLRYMDANRKGVWAIPFDTPICGYVEQVDLYDNGRLQMLFISGNKMYLLDRVGRFVYGYPAKLPKEVVMGPELVEGINGMKYSVVVLNADNSVSWYDISGKPVAGWSDIVAPEFIKELPQIADLGGVRYWILRAPSQLLLYTIEGKRIEMADKKKKIDRDCEPVFVEKGVIRVKCTDGKEYNWNLETGKIKKWNN